MREIRGKRVLVTGAARGIGRAIVSRFAERGAAVVLTDFDAVALEVAVGALRSTGASATGLRLDVTDPEEIARVRRAILSDAGPLDILVNNAGVVYGGPLLEVPLENHRKTFDVNILGLVAMTRAFLPDLIARPSAHVVNVASAAGYVGLPLGTTYASSKWAVLGFSESLRGELRLLGHRHVRVTAVCPSYVGTGLFEGARPIRMTRMLDPDRLARQIVRAVEGNRRNVRTPWPVKLTPFLKGVLPGAVFERASAALGVTSSMRGWRGRGGADAAGVGEGTTGPPGS